MIRLFSERNISKFKAVLSQSNWNTVLECYDTNIATAEFMKIYNYIFNKTIPLVRLSQKRAKDKKWFIAGLRKSKQTEQTLFRLKTKSPTQNNINKYKQYKSVYSKCTKHAKQQYFEDLINTKKQNVTMLWKIFGPVINPGKSKKITTKVN